MIALDVVLTPIFRIEDGTDVQCSQYSSRNHDGTCLCLGYGYGDSLYPYDDSGIPPLSSHRSDFGTQLLQVSFIRYGRKFYFSALGEILEQVLLVPLFPYPVMVLFTGSAAKFSWFIYTPRFWSNLDWYSHSFLAFRFLIKQEFFKRVQDISLEKG